MPEILANPPWYIPSVFALVGVILIFQGNARQKSRIKWTGVGFALFAAGIITISTLLESTEEKIVRQTVELVDSVDKRNWNRFKSYLDPDVVFDKYKGSETLRSGAEKTVVAADVKNITIGNTSVKSEPGELIVNFTATAEIAEAGRRVPTNWRFYWAKSSLSPDYLLYRIEYLQSDQVGDNEVKSRLK